MKGILGFFQRKGPVKKGEEGGEEGDATKVRRARQLVVLERRANNVKGFKDFHLKPRPESGLDCLACAEFALVGSTWTIVLGARAVGVSALVDCAR